MYSLIFRSQCVQNVLNRAHVISKPVQLLHTSGLASLVNNPLLVHLTKSKSAAQWTCWHHDVGTQSRHLHVGAHFFTKAEGQEVKSTKQASVSRIQSPSGLSGAQRVKQAGKDFTYLIVVLIGLGVTVFSNEQILSPDMMTFSSGGLLYVIFQELFSSSSPSKLYGKAFEKCRSHPEVIGAFGEPIKGFGETTRRGRRQQVSHVEYIKDGQKHMRLKFYIEGSEPRLRGTVHTDCKENPETGKYEFRYIFVDVDAYPRRTIVVEDNR